MEHQIVNGTVYHANTPPEVIAVVEAHRWPPLAERKLLLFFYGDPLTGKVGDQTLRGYAGRSFGWLKHPVVVTDRRTLAGSRLIDHCVVKITTVRGRTLYRHPRYEENWR